MKTWKRWKEDEINYLKSNYHKESILSIAKKNIRRSDLLCASMN
jgi:hypothetical protein